jgi:cobalamin biosynthesis Co2+ chelatase CbiK
VKNGKQYEAVARELTNYQNRLDEVFEGCRGVISEDAYKVMLDANKDYVPFFRVMDEDPFRRRPRPRGEDEEPDQEH